MTATDTQAMLARLQRLFEAIARASRYPNNAVHAHAISRDFGTVIGIASTFNGEMETFLRDMEADYLGTAASGTPPDPQEGACPP